MDNKLNIVVTEDNGGGLALWVWENDTLIYSHTGYEYIHGNLCDDIAGLIIAGLININGGWEGNENNSQKLWDNLTNYEYGYKIIASGPIDNISYNYGLMGVAGHIEFGNL